MKKAILICPDRRKALASLDQDRPIALATYIGRPLIEHALYGFKHQQITDLLVIASDRPAELREYLGTGSAWGMKIKLLSCPKQPEIHEAQELDKEFGDAQVNTLDCLPQAPETRILDDISSWHNSRRTLLPLLAIDQVGAREIQPGIWSGLRTRIAPDAEIQPPCWIGHCTTIGSKAVIGPDSFIESHCLIDHEATVTNSTINEQTYIGPMTLVASSVTSGNQLTNWKNGSHSIIHDRFLLSGIQITPRSSGSAISRITALMAMLISFPALLLAPLCGIITGRRWIHSNLAVLPGEAGRTRATIRYHLFPGLPGKWKQWPMLWRIVSGHFSWTGNPPLSPDESSEFNDEFERLWTNIPPGLFTAPEAEGCRSPWGDEARAHAALFAARPDFKWRLRILMRGALSLIIPTPQKSRNHEH